MKPLAFAFFQTMIGFILATAATPAVAGGNGIRPAVLANDAMGVPAEAAALTDSEMRGVRAAGISAWLSALLGALPSQNTVQSQIGSSPPVTTTGDGPQIFTLSTPTVSVNLLADNTGTLPPRPPATRTYSFSSTRTFMKSFSFSF